MSDLNECRAELLLQPHQFGRGRLAHGLTAAADDEQPSRPVDYITNPRITEDEAIAILEGNATVLFGITTPGRGASE